MSAWVISTSSWERERCAACRTTPYASRTNGRQKASRSRAFTGAHLLHLAAAGCVLNDVYREAERLGVPIDGVRVTASGGFDTDTWQSTGISYAVDIDSPAPTDQINSV